MKSSPFRKNQPDKTSSSFLAFAELHADNTLLSDESKLLLLTRFYLELRLNVEQALLAARADMMLAPKVQTHRLWEERPR
jgi:hypothetical protein